MQRQPSSEYWDQFWSKVSPQRVEWYNPAAHQFKKLYSRYMHSGGTVLEIGCAPGRWTCEFARMGLITTGIDISPLGIDNTRQCIAAAGLSASVILGDISDPAMSASLRDFDYVVSAGVVEHFFGKDLERMVEAHMRSLKPGGLAIVTVPNISPSSQHYGEISSNEEALNAHNLEVMSKDALRSLFSRWSVEDCGYMTPIPSAAPAYHLKGFWRRAALGVLGWIGWLVAPTPSNALTIFVVVRNCPPGN